MESKVIKNAKIIWSYFASFNQLLESDAIVVCCSYDLRVCDYACELVNKIHARTLVFSGNTGNWTRYLWDETEAQIFRARAIQNGIDPSMIKTEEKATNIGENIAFSKGILPEAKSVTFVSKPNTILRIKLSAPIQWPEISARTSCPSFEFPNDVSNVVGVLGLISEMVGDIQRIIKYPELGFQESHDFPKQVLDAYEYLKSEGFTEHLMKEN